MGSWKFDADMDAAELPRFLRELAQALETGRAGGGLAAFPAGHLRKLVLVAEAEDAGFRLRLKAKGAGEVLVPMKKPPKAEGYGKPGGKPGGTVDARPGPRLGGKAADASQRAQEKYRQLKKSMQADYKALKKAAETGVMPAQDVLESFLGLSEAMVEMEQPVRDPAAAGELARANKVFLEDALALRRAVSARDVAALAEVLSRLERRKSACHAQFR